MNKNDFSFMRAGHGGGIADNDMVDPMTITSLIMVYTEKAIIHAAEYAHHHGRAKATPHDLQRCMKHEILELTLMNNLEKAMDDAISFIIEKDYDNLEETNTTNTNKTCACVDCMCRNDSNTYWVNWKPRDVMFQLLKIRVDQLVC